MRIGNDAENSTPDHPLMYVFRFQLASLYIDRILPESTIDRRRKRLSNMTKKLDLWSVYGPTLRRISEQERDTFKIGMAALMLITYAERPLRVDELCHALAVELGSPDFNADNVPSISTVLSCCQGLISVDEEESTVRLINFTLQEYLFSPRMFIVREPHSEMAKICLTYLNSQLVKALAVTPSPDLGSLPFLEYCSIYWGVHAKRGPSALTTSLALGLFQEYDGHISTKLLLEHEKQLDPRNPRTDLGAGFRFRGLHCASFFGISEVVAALLEMEYYDVNARDFMGYTPLAWAALTGHAEVVEMLLGQREVKPYMPDNNGRTPLSHAAWKGHQSVVKILLAGNEVSLDKQDNGGRTPLSLAAAGGHDELVKILLGRKEVESDRPDETGRTPLSFAAEEGHEAVVKILVKWEGVDSHRPDNTGKTPLWHAAKNGHEGVVKILLARKALTPNRPDDSGSTPLMVAEMQGHKAVIELLKPHEFVTHGGRGW